MTYFSCLKHFGVVYLLDRQVTIDIQSDKHLYKKEHMVHIYILICILCGHIIWHHNCPYHILVHIQVGDSATDEEKRLLSCVRNARDAKEKAEQENYSVMWSSKRFEGMVSAWCWNVPWGITAFGEWHQKL